MILVEPIARDWVDWSSLSAGLAGLFLTIMTLIQATGAKKAASEAREAVWTRGASDRFGELAKLSERLVELIQFERLGESSLRVRELLAGIPQERARFERFLKFDSDKLVGVEADFERLTEWLSRPTFFDDPDVVRQASQIAMQSSRTLGEIYGRLLALLDKEK